MASTLVDTNVLLRQLQPWHPHAAIAIAAIDRLRNEDADLCVAPQNLVESWVVATRPLADNGLGLEPLRADAELKALTHFFRVLEGETGVAALWENLVARNSVVGKRAHDAHLVAVMQVYGLTDILTFNGADFRRYAGIRVLDPMQV